VASWEGVSCRQICCNCLTGVWCTEYNILRRDKIKVYMRQADQNEVSFKLNGLSEQLTVSQLSLVSFVKYNQCFKLLANAT
jgi:hypothetical protein